MREYKKDSYSHAGSKKQWSYHCGANTECLLRQIDVAISSKQCVDHPKDAPHKQDGKD